MIIYFDTETTSLSPGQICQLSYVMEDRNKILEKNFFFTVDKIDVSASEITGLTIEKLASLSGGRNFSDHITEIEKDFSTSDLIVAHNFSFDYNFMQEEFSRCNKLFSFNQELCSMKYFTPILKLEKKNSGGYKYPKLSELVSYYGIDISTFTFHDARQDAKALYLAVKAARGSSFLIDMDFAKFL